MTDSVFDKKYKDFDFNYQIFRIRFTAACHFPEQAMTYFKELKKVFEKIKVDGSNIFDFIYEDKYMKIDEKILNNAKSLFEKLKE